MNMTLRYSLAVLGLCLPAAAQTWTPGPAFPLTPAQRTGGIAFHPVQGGLVMYGGLQSGPTATLDTTWMFDGTAWTQLTPATQPPPRWGHRMVYDSHRARIVTFGGRSPTTTAAANDTWEWNGVDWQQVVTANAPSPRAFYSMAFDERRGRTVIFGSQTASSDTWEYDGTNWYQITTPTTPAGVDAPAMAYDKGRGVVVMFGGWNGITAIQYTTTWEYDGVDWTLRPTTNHPVTGYRTTCVYDDVSGRVMLYGGYNGTAQQNVWEYDGNDWTMVLTGGPTMITEAYGDFDPIRRNIVYFGGSGPGGIANETWFYNGSTTAIAAAYGKGCATGTGTPVLTPATTPQLGGTYQLDLTGAPLASIGFMAHGFSNTASPLGALPVDLGPLGLGGCRLENSAEALSLIVVTGSVTSSSMSFPNVPAFTGIQFYSQVLVLDSAAPNGTGGMSNGVHAVLGS